MHALGVPLSLASLDSLPKLAPGTTDTRPHLQLINDHGMEVFSKFFTKLVHTSASQIFPGLNRPIGSAGNAGNYSLLQEEMRKISHEVDQATRISESIETGTEDIFRDFDLSTFMEHFRLDALEKTILALAFKLGSRSDLKTKGMFLLIWLVSVLLSNTLLMFRFPFGNPVSMQTLISSYS